LPDARSGSVPGDATADLAAFSATYAQARAKFLARAAAAGAHVTSHVLPLPGVNGEELALDAAWHGPPDADRLLIVSSACHGIEGHAGSAVQCALLQDDATARATRASGVALLHLHALNPHGFSWGRRVTSENVDLNRNFVDFTKPLPANPAYQAIAPLLVPRAWPPGPLNALQLALFTLRHGPRAAQRAVSGGQYVDPQGLFFGGHAPAWSQLALRRVLRERVRERARVAWVDVHTGLGPRGVGERIFAARHDAATLARARAWWGEGITSTHDASSTSAALNGEMWSVMQEECPGTEHTGIALEFGTAPRLEVLQALRGDQWLALHPDAPAALRRSIRQRLRAAFYVETPDWQRSVLHQAIAAVHEGVRGLA
jgi:hypothetical protein